jgi:hypothetical protein
MKCHICEKEMPPNEYGNNSHPVSDGLCCDQCNLDVVIPARLQLAIWVRRKQEERQGGMDKDERPYELMAEGERGLVDQCFLACFDNIRSAGLKADPSDPAERLVDAIVQYIKESNR